MVVGHHRAHRCPRPHSFRARSSWRRQIRGARTAGIFDSRQGRRPGLRCIARSRLRRQPPDRGGSVMDKTINQKAWFLVLPVFLVVAFSAILPLMTVVNYSMQDTFGNNQFFWNGVSWFKELLDPTTDLGERFLASLWRNLFFSAVILAIEVPLGIVVALSMPREGWTVAACLVIMALPLLIPWNVVGTIWQIFGRPDIGLLGYTLNSLGLHYNYVSNELVKIALGQFDLGKAAALSLVYNLIIIIVCWVFYTVMTNAGAERRPAKGVA